MFVCADSISNVSFFCDSDGKNEKITEGAKLKRRLNGKKEKEMEGNKYWHYKSNIR